MPETVNSFNTAEGRYKVIKYTNGPEHLYSLDSSPGESPHLSHEDVMQGHTVKEREEHLKEHAEENEQYLKLAEEGKLIHEKGRYKGRLTPEGREFFNASEELAREAGETALEGASEEPEKTASLEVRPGEAVWHSRKNGDLKVTVLGPSEKYPDGVDPKTGTLYVQLRTEKGTSLANVRADRLEYPDNPLAEGNKAAKKIGEEMNGQADEVVDKLDEILPPSEKESKEAEEAKSQENLSEIEKILKRSEEREKELSKDYKKLLKAVELMVQGKQQEAEEALLDAKSGKQEPEKEEKKEPSKGDLGNKVGDAGQAEIRGQDAEGKPFIYRKNEKGEWEVSRNGNLANEWWPATPEMMTKDLGFELGRRGEQKKEEGEEEDDEDTVDVDAMNASLARQQELIKKLYETDDPEEKAKLMEQLQEENKKQNELLNGSSAKSEDEQKTEVKEVAISDQEAKGLVQERRKSRWEKIKKWLRPDRVAMAYLQTRGSQEPETSGGESVKKVTVVDEEGKPVVVEEKVETVEERRRRKMLIGGGIGVLALVGAGVIGYFLHKQGMPSDIINGFGHGHGSGIGPNHLPVHHIDLATAHLDPNTIHASTPDQFHEGVAHLLREQGIPVHHLTHAQMEHMTHYMQTHEIASGMREGAHGLEQNLTNFPGEGQHFANAQASAEQGFHIGADGTGREALRQYAEELQRIGAIS